MRRRQQHQHAAGAAGAATEFGENAAAATEAGAATEFEKKAAAAPIAIKVKEQTVSRNVESFACDLFARAKQWHGWH